MPKAENSKSKSAAKGAKKPTSKALTETVTEVDVVDHVSHVSTTLRLGVDLGTNTTVLQLADNDAGVTLSSDSVRSVVGFPKQGIIPGILPSDADVVFGDEAVNLRLHLDLKSPLRDGFVEDVAVAKVFTGHLRTLVDPDGVHKLWGVVGAPANATPKKQKDIRSTMVGFLERMLVVPEPFLAAMGLREDPGFLESGAHVDPTKHSLIVDIGAGTTDLCLVRGYFPTAEDQTSFNKAGDFIDNRMRETVERRYPDLSLSPVTVTAIKEKHAYVGGDTREATVKVYVDGRPQKLDFGEIIHEACEAIIPDIVSGIKELLKCCDSDSTENVLQNIIVTGGGCMIDGLCERVQEVLRADGYEDAVTRRPSDYKRLVAGGALKISENVRDDQWQVPF